MKRSQLNQTFIYIMAILVVGTILLIGYRSISSIFDQGCDVERSRFLADLEDSLRRNTNFGFAQSLQVRAPCDYEEICFVDAEANDLSDSPHIILQQEVSDGTGYTVFLIRQGIVEPVMQNSNIKVDNDEGFVCIESLTGRFSFNLEGVGRGKVGVSSD